MRNSEQAANEDMRLVTTERELFEADHTYLDLSTELDAWGGLRFKHSHIHATWMGWQAHALRAPPAAQPVIAPEPQEGAIQDLRTAAQAVVDRWDTPLWKDAPATALYINTLRKVLETMQPVNAPAGWQLVPIEPTQAMLDYADKTVPPVFSIGDEYRAMLAAAPPPTPPKEPT